MSATGVCTVVAVGDGGGVCFIPAPVPVAGFVGVGVDIDVGLDEGERIVGRGVEEIVIVYEYIDPPYLSMSHLHLILDSRLHMVVVELGLRC